MSSDRTGMQRFLTALRCPKLIVVVKKKMRGTLREAHCCCCTKATCFTSGLRSLLQARVRNQTKATLAQPFIFQVPPPYYSKHCLFNRIKYILVLPANGHTEHWPREVSLTKLVCKRPALARPIISLQMISVFEDEKGRGGEKDNGIFELACVCSLHEASRLYTT